MRDKSLPNQINLYDDNLTDLTESDLIQLCELRGINPSDITELFLGRNKLKDFNFITSNTPFINIKKLNCVFHTFEDITNIKYLKNLEYLSFITNGNSISDITELKYLKKLKFLYLSNNKEITDLSPIYNLKDLQTLFIDNLTQITDKKDLLKNLLKMKSLNHLQCPLVFIGMEKEAYDKLIIKLSNSSDQLLI